MVNFFGKKVLINTLLLFWLLGKAEWLLTRKSNLSAEAVQGAALTLESVDDVHRGDGLATSVLGVGHGVTDDVLEEDLEDRAGLLVDETRDALHTTTTSETADSGLGNALDIITENLAVTLRAALAETFASLSTSGHVKMFEVRR